MDDPKPTRSERGSRQIYRDGVDRATGKPRLYARFTIHGVRHHPRLDATTMEAARAEVEERKKAAKEGRPYREAPKAPAPTMTVRQLAERFCGNADDFMTGAGGEHRDPVHYRRQFWSVLKCHVLPTLGELDVMAVRPKDVKALRTKLLDERQLDAEGKEQLDADGKPVPANHPRTIQRALNHVSRLFNWAVVDEELIDRDNPAARVRKPSPKSSTEFYTTDEVARMLATAAKSARSLYPIIAFAFYSGCRRGEIAALQWGDVDLDGGTIVVQRSWKASARKSGKPVVVQVHPTLGAILRAHRPKEPGAADLVFPDPKTGGMRDKFDTWGLRELATKAKVRRFKSPWHSFRHAQATELAAQGASLTEIRDALGQSTLQMAANYSHLSAASVKARVHSLPALGPAVVDLNSRRKDAVRTSNVKVKKASAKS